MVKHPTMKRSGCIACKLTQCCGTSSSRLAVNVGELYDGDTKVGVPLFGWSPIVVT